MHHGNVSPRTVKFRIFIPQNYNNGRPVDPTLFAFIEDVFVSLAGGWSSPGHARGAGLDPDGKSQQDIHHIYEIAVDPELVQCFSRLAHAIGRLLQQHSVYYEIEHSTEICIEPVCPQALVPSPVAPADVAKNGRGTIALGSNGKGA